MTHYDLNCICLISRNNISYIMHLIENLSHYYSNYYMHTNSEWIHVVLENILHIVLHRKTETIKGPFTLVSLCLYSNRYHFKNRFSIDVAFSSDEKPIQAVWKLNTISIRMLGLRNTLTQWETLLIINRYITKCWSLFLPWLKVFQRNSTLHTSTENKWNPAHQITEDCYMLALQHILYIPMSHSESVEVKEYIYIYYI